MQIFNIQDFIFIYKILSLYTSKFSQHSVEVPKAKDTEYLFQLSGYINASSGFKLGGTGSNPLMAVLHIKM